MTATAIATQTPTAGQRQGARVPQAAKRTKAPKAKASTRSDGAAAVEGEAQAALVDGGGRDVLVPLDQLVLSDANVRKVLHEEGIAELAALIESQGLAAAPGRGRAARWPLAVVAGGRRLRAMQRLAAEGRWAASQPVECKLYDDTRAVEVSLAENCGREAMHPADEMEAFRQAGRGGHARWPRSPGASASRC